MFVQAVLVSLLEYNAVEPSYTDSVTALCMLEYYIYLSTVYRQELNDRLDKYVDEIEAAGFRLRRLTTEVIAAFANSIDAKDKYTHGHSSRVAEYARKLAEMNGKGEDQCDEVYYAGLLHDIGKIGIPESIITKEGRLTTEEYDMIKQHPTLGAQILGNISEFPYLSIGALYHHERYDGRGYPEGLKGTDIPETARIISVADAYDAMTSRRSYRDPIPQQKVREEIVKGTGTQFDPEYARLMLHLIDDDLEYEMSEHAESTGLTELNEMIIDGYRTSVTDGILINTFMTTISFSLMSDEEATGISPTPSIILFDSLDGKVHTDEKEIADLNYFEYGELMYDMTVNVEGARTIQSRIRNENSGRVSKNGDYVIEAVRIRDHALLRIFGQSMNAEIIIALPDNTRFMYIGFTGDHCCFRDFDIVKSEVESPEGYIPRIAEEISFIKGPSGDIPNVQIDGYRTAHSEGIPVRDGLKFTFHSKCLPTARLVWHCPFIDLFGSDTGVVNDYSYRDLAFMRFDGEFWECDPNCSARLNVIKTAKFQGWDAWKKFNQDGFDTEVLFRVDDNKITVITENAGISIRNTAIIAEVDKTVYAAITGDQVAITNIRIS
ncbi:MAG: HD-GYP domain-containing protein [Lachnospiraceae bacterium]|nr:HD-GYP domain-containing protein [Lachnospiraceae bacterium]